MLLKALLAASLLLAGCKGFVYHGNYCGPGYPRPNEHPPLFDDVDAVCRDHDNCYSGAATPAYACDARFIETILSLSLNAQCQNSAREMAVYFAGLHPPRDRNNPLIIPVGVAAKGRYWPETLAAAVERGTLLLAEGHAGPAVRCCDRRVVPLPGSPCYPEDATPLQLRVMAALTAWHHIAGLRYEPYMPRVAVSNARRLARVPEGQHVIAIVGIDAGALVFTESGMFHGQLIGGRGFVSYEDLMTMPVHSVASHAITVGTRNFRATDWPANALYRVMIAIRGAIAEQRTVDAGTRSDGPPGELAGRWRGTVRQEGTPPYPVELILDRNYASARQGNAIGRITYPSLDCGGILTLMSAHTNEVRVHELLEYGAGRCVEGGVITLIRTREAVSFTWTGGRYSASSVLYGTE